jgi:hypothetical protein
MPAASRLPLFTGIKYMPPMWQVVVRNVWPLIVAFTGARTFPNASLGSNGSSMPQALVLRHSLIFGYRRRNLILASAVVKRQSMVARLALRSLCQRSTAAASVG